MYFLYLIVTNKNNYTSIRDEFLKNLNRFLLLASTLGFVFCVTPVAYAGFLEMPVITEVPDLKRESLLKDLDVPSVRDRDPDPESGARLNVTHFKLQGIVEFPELGITKKEIDRLIERIRFNLMQEYKLLDSGYTEEEVNEVIDLLVEIEEQTLDRHVTDLELQKLIWLIREQRSKRGITLGVIETVADKITQFYRERGFILAKAYIPEQQIRDGVVTLTLLLGTLGEVAVNGNKMYSEASISSVFESDQGLPVTGDMVEENIYLINDYPGLSVLGLFEPGAQVGDTKLNLDVKAEQRYHANVRYDNHGTEDTGEQRLYGEVLFNNLAGASDLLHIGALSSFFPDNTTYWLLKYSLNLFSPRWRLGMGYTQNQFVLAQNAGDFLSSLKLSGETTQADITLIYKLKRSRVENYNFQLIRENIASNLLLGNTDLGGLLNDEIENTSLLFDFDVLQEESRRLHQGFVRFTSGALVKGLDPGQDDKYGILMSDYTLLTFVKVPWFNADTKLIMRSSLQYTDAALSSVSQFFLGGPTRARGYPVNQFSADSAVYLGADWVLNFPAWMNFDFTPVYSLKNVAQPFFFADASYGVKKSLLATAEDSSGTFYDIGLGVRFFYKNDFQGNLQVAFPVKSDLSDEDLEKPDSSPRLVFDFQYSFN